MTTHLDTNIQSVFDRVIGHLEAMGFAYPAIRREVVVLDSITMVFLTFSIFNVQWICGLLLAVVCAGSLWIDARTWREHNRHARNWTPSVANRYVNEALRQRELNWRNRESWLVTLLIILCCAAVIWWLPLNEVAETRPIKIGMLALVLRAVFQTSNLYIQSSVPMPPPEKMPQTAPSFG